MYCTVTCSFLSFGFHVISPEFVSLAKIPHQGPETRKVSLDQVDLGFTREEKEDEGEKSHSLD